MTNVQILLALAEEDPYSLRVVRNALEKEGYHVTVETVTRSNVERIPIHDFNLLITDRLTLLEKSRELNPTIMAILVLDTSSRSTPTAHAIRASADDYLFRPFGLTELGIRVSHCVEKLETSQRDCPPESVDLRLNEKILNMVKAMAHDVRGSLLSISATLKMLSRGHYGKMDETVVHRIKELFSKTSRLIGVTEEYLGRSFSADGELDAEVESLDLMKDILIPVLKELSSELKGHHLLIDHRLLATSNKPIFIRTNKIWLKMAFRNLLKNAIRYGEKEGMIALGFEKLGSCCRFNVYNRGKPIPEEYRGKLFTKFMGNVTDGKKQGGTAGTGLGLYLIFKVIQRLGGEIWYEAKENGSNFLFTVPLASAPTSDSSLPIRAQLGMATADKEREYGLRH